MKKSEYIPYYKRKKDPNFKEITDHGVYMLKGEEWDWYHCEDMRCRWVVANYHAGPAWSVGK